MSKEKIGSTAEELWGKFKGGTIFRGEKYPSNFEFTSQYEQGDIPEFTIVGLALAYVRDREGKLIYDDRVLVWTQEMVVAMSRKRYKKGNNIE